MSEITVTEVTAVTPELVTAMARLIAQLSASSPAPTEALLATIIASPGSRLLVANDPVAGIVECYTRVVLLGQSPGLVPLASALVPAAVCLVLGYHYFKSSEWRFADVI